MNQIDVMKHARKTFETISRVEGREGRSGLVMTCTKAIAELDQAIEQAGKMEPVLVVARHDLEKLLKRPEGDKHIKAFIPPGMGDEVLLYTHPPTAAPQDNER